MYVCVSTARCRDAAVPGQPMHRSLRSAVDRANVPRAHAAGRAGIGKTPAPVGCAGSNAPLGFRASFQAKAKPWTRAEELRLSTTGLGSRMVEPRAKVAS